jgi:predicted AlkP superfamily phosphohydrolase/phosphomutase/tetratricopeptide (TPR) repeat protein
MAKPRVMLIGWDAADWKVIRPLLAAGQMPNLARLIAGGVHGNIATIYPVLSPMLWTSIATGKRAYKHGIHGFSEPLPDGTGIRPITLLSRKTKAVWNILNQTGHRSLVVGWWPSHPAEPIDGVMVSNHFPQPMTEGVGSSPRLPPGSVHPSGRASSLAELRVNPMELDGDFFRLFVPGYSKVDQEKDKRLHTLGKIIAETMSIHAVATDLLATEPWDFAAIYYSGIDHFGHAFMSYHPPRLPWVSEEDFGVYQHVVANAYRYHDAMLGTLLGFTDEATTVILMSDHGFHADHLRPGYIPAEPAGPAVEHRHFGVLCLKGPELHVGQSIYGAGLLDICPTVLKLFGLPPGKDMDGKVLLTAFKKPPTIEPVDSWDHVPGDAGIHPPETRVDPVASAEAFRQLVELGYVTPPTTNVQDTIDECVRELKYNLARAYRDGDCCRDAVELAEYLWARWPKDHRFGILLVECLGPLRETARRRAAIEELGRRINRYQEEAAGELARLEERRAGEPKAEPSPHDAAQKRAHFEERQLRELAYGRPFLMEWLFVTQALLEKRPDEARHYLSMLTDAEAVNGGSSQRIAGAFSELGDLETSRALLEDALRSDPENAPVLSQLAAIHFKAGRYEAAIVAATNSLSLMYFQPGVHNLLGQSLMEIRRFAEAEKELQVAVAQSPRNLAAHDLLARLYRDHLHRPVDAFPHEGRAQSLRHELASQSRSPGQPGTLLPAIEQVPVGNSAEHRPFIVPGAPFSNVAANQIITIVSGLPRSGTSMMMQILAAAGLEPLTDSKRPPDEDNPLGYLEFEKALDLANDQSWLPQARGKVVKIVAQLLPWLPSNEHYNVILMERNLSEVLASQSAMLRRQNRRGAALEERQLLSTYADQIRGILERMAGRPEVRLLIVNYSDLLGKPATGIERIAEFLAVPFNRDAAAGAIRPQLRRQQV